METLTMKKEYIAPQLSVSTFRMERGYAVSGLVNRAALWVAAGHIGSVSPAPSGQETWNEDNTYSTSGWY